MSLKWKTAHGDHVADAAEGTYTIEMAEMRKDLGYGPPRRYDLYYEPSGIVTTGFQRTRMGWFTSLAKAKAKASNYHRNVIVD